MADNKKLKGWQDDIQIDSKDPGEMRYWAKRLKRTAGQIMVAMHVTGSRHPRIIRRWLADNWQRIRHAAKKNAAA